jgi:hypothetical protein
MVRFATAALAHLTLIAAAFVCVTSPAADSGAFVGNVMVEWLDHDDFKLKPAMRLMEEFAFVEGNGQAWRAPKGHIIEGGCIPGVFRSLVGLPFEGKQRRAAVLHDYYCHARTMPWLEVHRMFYRASLAAGVDETEAKIMYMAVYAEGQRWEPKQGSRCYNSCHAAAASLAWRPIATEADWQAVVEWIEQNNPALAEIEQRINAAIKRPGPHIFAQGH